jgi:hypothetical protein
MDKDMGLGEPVMNKNTRGSYVIHHINSDEVGTMSETLDHVSTLTWLITQEDFLKFTLP